MICKKIDIIKLLKEISIITKMQQIQQQQFNNTTKKIYFKWINTVNTLYLPIDSCWILDEFIEYVKNKIGDQNIELVKTMQGTDILLAEDAEAVESSNEITVYQKFCYDWIHNYLAFYIRKIPEVVAVRIGTIINAGINAEINIERLNSIETSSEPSIQCSGGGCVSREAEIDRECVICFNVFPITNYTPYGCQHFACAVCVKECIRTNNNRCSICRLE